ncbi:MAG: T9SS type A sorting domain-containing protein [Chitinophagaceae bacterium]|nr:T9SS type A sorting domain-containing protein [Chitinophagaceae bacterium]
MKTLFFLMCFTSFLNLNTIGQVVNIVPSQYVVTIQANQPNSYDYLTYVSYSKHFLFKDQAGSVISSFTGYGAGTYNQQFYITEVNKPATVTFYNNVSYQQEQCESGDPNCGGGMGYLRTSKTGVQSENQPKKPKTGTQAKPSARTNYGGCGYCWWQSYSFSTMNVYNLPMKYPFFDTTITYGSESFTISVRQAGDNNYNLPSSDNISIKASAAFSAYRWEYQLFDPANPGNPAWQTIPSNYVSDAGKELIINGQSLFGSNWMQHINKTVLFRMKQTNQGGLTSNILVYTHRLSSPKITTVQAFQNPCYGYDTAYIKVQFNRQLLTDEKINIFLQDTVTRLDYSALNLSNASFDAGTNTYTWKRELVQGSYKVSLIGKYFDYATYTGSPGHFAYVRVIDPEPLRLYLSQIPVSCFEGNNGIMNVGAKGGVGNYKYQLLHVDSSFGSTFTNFTNPVFNSALGTMDQPVPGLTANIYKVRLRDGNNCLIRDSLGREIYRTLPVKQPTSALSVSLLNVSPITAYDRNDGAINIRITGGTPFVKISEDPNYAKYRFEWRDSATNALLTSGISVDTVNKFEAKIQNLTNGTYSFKAWDASFDNAAGSNRQGCFIQLYIKISRPLPLNVNVLVDSVINCYGDAKGKLKAIPTGGIPLTVDSVKYNFTWYKKVSGSFVNQNINDSVLRNLNAGEYRVEIRDKYNNLTSYNYILTQPAVISTAGTSTPSSCYFTANGSMTVNVSGGTAPYRYEWSNGAKTQSVPNVPGGSYVVVVTDANLCTATRQVVVTSPSKINTVETITPVGCNGTSSGVISLAASGGSGGYTYQWSNGSTGSTATNLAAGTYWYRVTDTQGCYDSSTIVLESPEAYTINAGPDRKLCIGQTIQLEVTNNAPWLPLNAVWTTPQGTVNGNKINVNSSGNYIVTVSNASGCQKKDTVTVTPFNATVNTSFTVSTQAFAGENTTLVNISPALQDSAKWLLPTGAALTVISQSKNYCEVKFADTGRYVVGIRAYYTNGCIDEKYKEINVVRKENFGNLSNQNETFLKQIGLYPNPNTGTFTLSLLFTSPTVARIRIINMLSNATVSDKSVSGSASYTENYSITGVPAGTYVVLIETPKGNFVHKLNKL